MEPLLVAAILPDPPYLAVPSGAVLAGLVSAVIAWLTDPDPDWASVSVQGNILGGGSAVVLVMVATAAGVQ